MSFYYYIENVKINFRFEKETTMADRNIKIGPDKYLGWQTDEEKTERGNHFKRYVNENTDKIVKDIGMALAKYDNRKQKDLSEICDFNNLTPEFTAYLRMDVNQQLFAVLR